MTNSESVEVTQADRDAAAEFLRGDGHAFDKLWADCVEAGRRDEHIIVQTLAKHRLAAVAQPHRSVEAFLRAIIDRTPNGEWIEVQYHSDGDWSVSHRPTAAQPQRVDEDAVAEAARKALAAWLLPFEESTADRRFNAGLRAGVEAMRAALAAMPPAEDEAYVRVPKKPTEAMLNALGDGYEHGKLEEKWEPANQLDAAECAYKAMLAAAPHAQQKDEDDGE